MLNRYKRESGVRYDWIPNGEIRLFRDFQSSKKLESRSKVESGRILKPDFIAWKQKEFTGKPQWLSFSLSLSVKTENEPRQFHNLKFIRCTSTHLWPILAMLGQVTCWSHSQPPPTTYATAKLAFWAAQTGKRAFWRQVIVLGVRSPRIPNVSCFFKRKCKALWRAAAWFMRYEFLAEKFLAVRQRERERERERERRMGNLFLGLHTRHCARNNFERPAN